MSGFTGCVREESSRRDQTKAAIVEGEFDK
jgi:hypothetical protein